MQGPKASSPEIFTIVCIASNIKALHFMKCILLVDNVLILGNIKY